MMFPTAASPSSGYLWPLKVICLLFQYVYNFIIRWLRLKRRPSSSSSKPINNDQLQDDDEAADFDDCVVCLSNISHGGGGVRILSPCKHTFHAHCIDTWLKFHSTCPLCRTQVALEPLPPSSHSHLLHNLKLFFSCLYYTIGNIAKWMLHDPNFGHKLTSAFCEILCSL